MNRHAKTLKFPRIYHMPTSQRIDRGDRVSHDYWEHIQGKRVVLTAKMDGGNTCIDKDGNVFARSHAMVTRDTSFDYLKSLVPRFLHILIDNDVAIYGENLYNVHTVIYRRLPEWFMMFAARRGDMWLSWDDVARLSSLIGIPTVPVLLVDTFDNRAEFEQMIYDIAKSKTCFGEEYMEGIVVRLYDAFLHDRFADSVFKWVSDSFDIRGKHWSKGRRIIQNRS